MVNSAVHLRPGKGERAEGKKHWLHLRVVRAAAAACHVNNGGGGKPENVRARNLFTDREREEARKRGRERIRVYWNDDKER